MALVPPAPILPGDAILEIFVFPGDPPIARPLDESNRFSDSNRLEFLGRVFTSAAYTDVMSKRWASCTGHQLNEIVANALDGFMERNAAAYQWSQRVHGYPQGFDRRSLPEARRLFCVYAGAVFVEHGFIGLREWIARLVEVA
ncbi:hypothetical protein C2E23DRAFT_863122 [Lenzites betulinus]|nr:hypothetical protein C2E23DRAFT_863122 [Lenzites betulinus]